ncbi:MAG: DUF5058 family protein [Clostridia bacterium]|nr:DUF5058 family protein [Clostridia bacterium]MBR4458063.1 DUF5058 family protein [Clostridia bacterium]
MEVLQSLNSGGVYLICGGIVAFIAAVCVVFMVRAWRAGLALGMDRTKMKRAVTASATFSVLPSVGIFLGVVALSGMLGTPWPWLRLSVIGALHYETQVADAAVERFGTAGGGMTLEIFPTVALLMSVCIMWGMILSALFNKKYTDRLRRAGEKPEGNGKKAGGFGDKAMAAMFIGMVSAYLGSYLGSFISRKPGPEGGAEYVSAVFSFRGPWMPLAVALAAALAMAVFTYFSEKKKMAWLDGFSIAGSMLIGMLVAAVLPA